MKTYNLSNQGLVSLIRETIEVDQPFSYLEEFTRTLYNKDDIPLSLNKYHQHVIDDTLDWYNFFVQENYFSESNDLNKVYAKEAALFEGYMNTLDRLSWINASDWYFDPTQQELFYK